MPKPLSPFPPLAIIAGPTASGKSGLALALAQATGGVILNADSAQVYRDLRILSARPDAADEACAEHRLYGTRDGAEACSAAAWAADARDEIAAIHAVGRLPILVGGTGLYLRTLLDGIAPVPPIDDAVRLQVRAAPVATNYEALSAEDPAAAAKLGPADTQRVARALEVVRSSGRSILDWRARRDGGIGRTLRVEARILVPQREALRSWIDRRFAQMMDDDAIGEVERLLARGLDPALPVMNAIGVRDIAGCLRGEVTREEAVASGQAATRQYAKRQVTWFRNQPPPEWLRLEGPLDIEQTSASFAAACARA